MENTGIKSAIRYLLPGAAVAFVVFIYSRFFPGATSATAALTLVLIVLFSATLFGLGPGLVSSIVGALCFNFFFLPPVGTFHIEGPHNIVAFAVFVVTAIVVSRLSSAVKERAEEAERGRREVEELYKFARILIETPETLEGAGSIARKIVEIFGVEYCGIHVPDRNGQWKHVSLSSNDPAATQLPDSRALHNDSIDDMIDEYGKKVRYISLKTPKGIVGVMALRAKNISEETIGAISSLVALTLERNRVIHEMEGPVL